MATNIWILPYNTLTKLYLLMKWTVCHIALSKSIVVREIQIPKEPQLIFINLPNAQYIVYDGHKQSDRQN